MSVLAVIPACLPAGRFIGSERLYAKTRFENPSRSKKDSRLGGSPEATGHLSFATLQKRSQNDINPKDIGHNITGFSIN